MVFQDLSRDVPAWHLMGHDQNEIALKVLYKDAFGLFDKVHMK